MAAPRKYTDEQLQQAVKLVGDGASVKEATNTVGIPVSAYYRHVRKPDPTPGGGRRRTRAQKVEISDDDLTGTFAMIASAPAIPMAAWVHCDYCALHFAVQAPKAAQQLVVLSQENPALRKVMVAVHTYLSELAWAGILGMYLGVPVMHHLAPDRVYNVAAPVLKMPPRGHTHAPNAPGATPGGDGTPFDHLDTDSLVKMAESMGMHVDPSDIVGANGNAPEPEPASPDTSAPGAAADTQAAPSDTDAE